MSPRAIVFLLLALGALLPPALQPAPDRYDKKLSIYTPRASYQAPVYDRYRLEYVGLADVLDPLTAISLKTEGKRWKLRLSEPAGEKEASLIGEFQEGKSSAKIRGKELFLAGRVIAEGGRLLVPLHSLPTILVGALHLRVELHESARRLFLENAKSIFQVTADPPGSGIALQFASPVSPTIVGDHNRLRLVFLHEPIAAGGGKLTPGKLTPDDKAPLVEYSEANGTSEIVVSGPTPLYATILEDRKTIRIEPIPSATASPQPPAAGLTVQSQGVATPAVASPSPKQAEAIVPASPRFQVVIDPSHGGEDSGIVFSEKFTEKEFALTFARRLRTELQNRGITVSLLRDSDVSLSFEQRAELANATHLGVFIGVHVGGPGRGVRVYTSLLSAKPEEKRPAFLAWNSAQSFFSEQSKSVAVAITGSLSEKRISSAMQRAPLRCLTSIALPAVSLEIAASAESGERVASYSYQQPIAAAVANAIVNVKARVEAQR